MNDFIEDLDTEEVLDGLDEEEENEQTKDINLSAILQQITEENVAVMQALWQAFKDDIAAMVMPEDLTPEDLELVRRLLPVSVVVEEETPDVVCIPVSQ